MNFIDLLINDITAKKADFGSPAEATAQPSGIDLSSKKQVHPVDDVKTDTASPGDLLQGMQNQAVPDSKPSAGIEGMPLGSTAAAKLAHSLISDFVEKIAGLPQAPPAQPPGVMQPPPGVMQPPPPASPLITTSNEPQKPLAVPMAKTPAKHASVIDRVLEKLAFPYGPMGMSGLHPSGQFPGGNPYGFPQQAYNNSFGVNPYQRAAGMGGSGGMLMAPHLAYGGLGGISPYASPAGFGMNAGLQHRGIGGGPMTEEQLRLHHQQQLEQIRGLAGQIDRSTGQPYSPAELRRRENSLNSSTTRALESMRTANPGGQQQPSQVPFYHQPNYGVMPSMGGGMPYPAMGGGYYPGSNPMFGGDSARSEAEQARRQYESLQDRRSDITDRTERGEGAPVSPEVLAARLQQLQHMARNTSARNGTTASVYDPVSGRNVQLQHNRGLGTLLGSGEGGLFGLGMNQSDSWQDYQDALERYNNDASRYRTWQQQQQQRASRAGGGDQRESRVRGRVERLEDESDQERQERRQQDQEMRRIQMQGMRQMYGVPQNSQSSGFGTAPPPMSQPQASVPGAAPATPAPAATPQAPQPAPMTIASSARSPLPSVVDRLVDTMTEKRAGKGAAGLGKSLLGKLGLIGAATGGGALIGGTASAASAPVDYWPEAFLRGASTGAKAGLGAGIGGTLGGAAGSALGRSRGLTSSIVGGTVGAAAGTALGGGVAAAHSIANQDALAWEAGHMPMLEKADLAFRRKSPAPAFGKSSSFADIVHEVLS